MKCLTLGSLEGDQAIWSHPMLPDPRNCHRLQHLPPSPACNTRDASVSSPDSRSCREVGCQVLPSYSWFKLTTNQYCLQIASRSAARVSGYSRSSGFPPAGPDRVSFAQLMRPGLTARFKISVYSRPSRQQLERECVLGVWNEVSFHAKHVPWSFGASHVEWICASQHQQNFFEGESL